MTHKILRAHSKNGSNALSELESKINTALNEGWQLNGTPFEDKSSLEWCQSVTMNPVAHIKAGEVNLREPAPPVVTPVREPAKPEIKPIQKQEHERLKKR